MTIEDYFIIPLPPVHSRASTPRFSDKKMKIKRETQAMLIICWFFLAVAVLMMLLHPGSSTEVASDEVEFHHISNDKIVTLCGNAPCTNVAEKMVETDPDELDEPQAAVAPNASADLASLPFNSSSPQVISATSSDIHSVEDMPGFNSGEEESGDKLNDDKQEPSQASIDVERPSDFDESHQDIADIKQDSNVDIIQGVLDEEEHQDQIQEEDGPEEEQHGNSKN